jgi:6-phosphogluconolactonase
MPRPVEITLKISATPAEITRAAAELFVDSANEAIKLRGVARIAISGGTTPRNAFELLGAEYSDKISWEKLQLFWVDERCVPPENAESNYGMTRATLLSKVPIPESNVHRMEGELDPEEAASRYEAEIRNAFKLEGAQTPTFDLILLGLGPDGHTASLFPHTEGLNEMARIAIANHVPQKDTWRMTLTWPVITQGRQVAFLIEGAEKASIVRTVFTGAYDPETYPAQLIRPASGKLLLLLDKAAAAELPPDATTLEFK